MVDGKRVATGRVEIVSSCQHESATRRVAITGLGFVPLGTIPRGLASPLAGGGWRRSPVSTPRLSGAHRRGEIVRPAPASRTASFSSSQPLHGFARRRGGGGSAGCRHPAARGGDALGLCGGKRQDRPAFAELAEVHRHCAPTATSRIACCRRIGTDPLDFTAAKPAPTSPLAQPVRDPRLRDVRSTRPAPGARRWDNHETDPGAAADCVSPGASIP
jgi:hypothetical protein